MNTYDYVAIQADGAAVSGRAVARDELELDRELEARGLVLSRARLAHTQRSLRGARLSHDDLITLTTQLAAIVGSGVHIVEGLEGIGQRLSRPASRSVVEDVVRSLRAGAMLSEALDRHPRSFPEVYRASVRSGEASGSLERVLEHLAAHMEWARGMRSTAIQALIYPAILMLALVGLVFILLYFVLPRLLTLFPGGRDQLPRETQLVMAVSDFTVGNIGWILGAVAACVTAFVLCRRKPAGRIALDAALLRVPRAGRVAEQLSISRFASTAALLQDAGCDVFTLLGVAGSTCGNAALSAAFERVGERVRRGQTITQALESEAHMDPMLVQMVAVGEKTGELARCFARLAKYYDDDIPRTVKRFLALLEPSMLLGAGIVVGLILLASLAPIFKLYESIG